MATVRMGCWRIAAPPRGVRAPWPLAGWLAAAAMVAGDLVAHGVRWPVCGAAARYGGAGAALALASAGGASREDLGLDVRAVACGVRAGTSSAIGAAAAVSAAAMLPRVRPLFTDERTVGGPRRGGLAPALAKIIFATVPPEELAYRSALLGLGLRSGAPARAAAWSSALFGLSHILPTLATMRRTAPHPHLVGRPLRQAVFVAGNVAATGLAGAAFAWLRLRSGSVVAPLLAHVALNGSALLASRAAQRPEPPASTRGRRPMLAIRRASRRRAAASAPQRLLPGQLAPARRALRRRGACERQRRAPGAGRPGGAAVEGPGSGRRLKASTLVWRCRRPACQSSGCGHLGRGRGIR